MGSKKSLTLLELITGEDNQFYLKKAQLPVFVEPLGMPQAYVTDNLDEDIMQGITRSLEDYLKKINCSNIIESVIGVAIGDPRKKKSAGERATYYYPLQFYRIIRSYSIKKEEPIFLDKNIKKSLH